MHIMIVIVSTGSVFGYFMQYFILCIPCGETLHLPRKEKQKLITILIFESLQSCGSFANTHL